MDRYQIAAEKYPIEKEFTKKFSGINRKIEGKTRIIKKFIWSKKLEGIWKFLSSTHILQKCVSCRFEEIIDPPEWCEEYLKWEDIKWASEQTTFLDCKSCHNELTASGSFLSDDSDGVKYECTDCGRASLWNFDLIPGAVEIIK